MLSLKFQPFDSKVILILRYRLEVQNPREGKHVNSSKSKLWRRGNPSRHYLLRKRHMPQRPNSIMSTMYTPWHTIKISTRFRHLQWWKLQIGTAEYDERSIFISNWLFPNSNYSIQWKCAFSNKLPSFSLFTVQHECIPQAVLGMDILCQAKSGMGKTAVFVLATLQQLEPTENHVYVLVMCHTRELAFQISKEYERFSKYMPSIKVRNKWLLIGMKAWFLPSLLLCIYRLGCSLGGYLFKKMKKHWSRWLRILWSELQDVFWPWYVTKSWISNTWNILFLTSATKCWSN